MVPEAVKNRRIGETILRHGSQVKSLESWVDDAKKLEIKKEKRIKPNESTTRSNIRVNLEIRFKDSYDPRPNKKRQRLAKTSRRKNLRGLPDLANNIEINHNSWILKDRKPLTQDKLSDHNKTLSSGSPGLHHEVKAACIRVRNELSKEIIKKNFIMGIRE